MTYKFADQRDTALDLFCATPETLDAVLSSLSPMAQRWIAAQEFNGNLGQAVCFPDETGKNVGAVIGLGTEVTRRRSRFHLAAALSKLPKGTYSFANDIPLEAIEAEMLGCLMLGYSFDMYKSKPSKPVSVCVPDGVDADKVEVLATSEKMIRDLVNTPTADMSPIELEATVQTLAQEFGASFDVVRGEALLEQNFPMIHAVGRASDTAPRLLDLRWGDTGPKITLVGKGICFDTGGLNLKPGGSMGLMKKDMGGAANTIGLAHAIMALNLPVQLRLLVPAAQNSVSGNSFRPGDVLTSRKGLTVEINNTDAEGRLVLADALAYACEDAPDLVVSMATLTGAARVAVGPDIAPFYATDDSLALALSAAASHVQDPVWRMPFHDPYETMIEPDIADLDNAPSGGFAGSITAALFLRRFVTETPTYVHFDIYSWAPTAAAGRSKGGFGQGYRSLLEVIADLAKS